MLSCQLVGNILVLRTHGEGTCLCTVFVPILSKSRYSPGGKTAKCENKKLNFEPLVIPALPINPIFQIKAEKWQLYFNTTQDTSFVTKSRGCLKHLPTLGKSWACKHWKFQNIYIYFFAFGFVILDLPCHFFGICFAFFFCIFCHLCMWFFSLFMSVCIFCFRNVSACLLGVSWFCLVAIYCHVSTHSLGCLGSGWVCVAARVVTVVWCSAPRR